MRVLQPLTKVEFDSLAARNKYYENRWPYYEAALRLIEGLNYSSVLELGPYERPLIQGADLMDLTAHIPNVRFQHDASDVPWPVADKQYDLFVALQVWEHLSDYQREAFGEVIRCSRYALLSFPLNWNIPGDCHHSIDEALIEEWTLFVKPIRSIVVSNRLVALWDFTKDNQARTDYKVGYRHAVRHLTELSILYKKTKKELRELKNRNSANNAGQNSSRVETAAVDARLAEMETRIEQTMKMLATQRTRIELVEGAVNTLKGLTPTWLRKLARGLSAKP
jgi:hypothetical protein